MDLVLKIRPFGLLLVLFLTGLSWHHVSWKRRNFFSNWDCFAVLLMPSGGVTFQRIAIDCFCRKLRQNIVKMQMLMSPLSFVDQLGVGILPPLSYNQCTFVCTATCVWNSHWLYLWKFREEMFSHALVVYEYVDLGKRKSMVKWRFPSIARVNPSCSWLADYPLHVAYSIGLFLGVLWRKNAYDYDALFRRADDIGLC